MRKTIGICLLALLAVAPASVAQSPPAASPPVAEKTPGKRLLVRFQESRLRGDATTATRSCTLLLQADGGPARVFVGTQAAITVADQNAPTTVFKNAGIEARVTATTLPDGRYRLDAAFEESSLLAAGGGSDTAVTSGNPILQVVKGESRIGLREGEAVPFASAVDPVTGEVVRIDLSVTAAPVPTANAPAGSGDARLRARLVLLRRQGETRTARRPYSVVLQAGAEEAASVFGGSMLPVQTRINDQVTVALKDVGAGLRLTARRVPDGRYRLGFEFSDGILGPGKGSPQVRTFESEAQLVLQEGETVTVVSAVDPQTGDVVEAELTIESVR
jgi:type II secretory pathway component HofQ